MVNEPNSDEFELDDDALEHATGGATTIDTSSYTGGPVPAEGSLPTGPGEAGQANSITVVYASTFIPFDSSF